MTIWPRKHKKDPFTSLHNIKENLPQWTELEILWNGALDLYLFHFSILTCYGICKPMFGLHFENNLKAYAMRECINAVAFKMSTRQKKMCFMKNPIFKSQCQGTNNSWQSQKILHRNINTIIMPIISIICKEIPLHQDLIKYNRIWYGWWLLSIRNSFTDNQKLLNQITTHYKTFNQKSGKLQLTGNKLTDPEQINSYGLQVGYTTL